MNDSYMRKYGNSDNMVLQFLLIVMACISIQAIIVTLNNTIADNFINRTRYVLIAIILYVWLSRSYKLHLEAKAYIIALTIGFILTKDLIHMKASMFIRGVYLKSLVVTILAVILPAALRVTMTEETILRFILVCVVSIASTFAVIYYVGLEVKERGMIMRMIKRKVLHKD